ncbi:MAG: hypothetical protein M3179_14695 [Actinomycetota bacterium]|nr:hypothetical protein [Actinomycetota bacterium]
MLVLLIILVIAAVGGVGAYVIMQFTGVFGTSYDEPRLRWSDRSGGGGGSGRVFVPRRLEEVPQGCLVSVLVAMGVWILLWLIVLVIGLRVLLA